MGLELRLFDGEVDDHFICKLCNKVFLDPVTNQCSHSFCSSCIKKRLASDKARICPICSGRLTNEFQQPSIEFKLKLLSLTIRCSHKCGATLQIADLPDHVAEECPNTPLECPNKGCQKKVRRCDMTRHMDECDYRQVVCEACDHVTVFCELFTHQSRVKCLERKLKQQVIRELRNANLEVSKHRNNVNKQHIRLEAQQRKLILDHARNLAGKPPALVHSPRPNNSTSPNRITSNETTPVFITEDKMNGMERHGDEDTGSPAPPSSRVGHALFPCKRCKKLFNPDSNRKSSCKWHAGPMIEVFGGTCFACGRVDYQPGCVAGFHQA